jgi:hypothetical protein
VIRLMVLVIGLLVLSAAIASPQEVVITGFPVGVAGGVSPTFFEPYYPQLQALVDTLKKYPLTQAVVTGGADGERYRQSHDAKNPALALGRAHALRNVLIYQFKIDSTRIAIRSEDVKAKGDLFRYVSVRVAREISDLDDRVSGLKSRVDTLENRPPVEKHYTEIREVPSPYIENLGLQFGAGLSSSPFGGMPIVAAAITWKRVVYVEGIVGHTFWNGTYRFQELGLETKRRMLGGHVIVYPAENLPVGIVGGWLRVEEIAQDYYEYTKLSEGLVLGLRALPFEFLSVTGAYNPSKRRVAVDQISTAANDQFMIYAMAHISLGGGK